MHLKVADIGFNYLNHYLILMGINPATISLLNLYHIYTVMLHPHNVMSLHRLTRGIQGI